MIWSIVVNLSLKRATCIVTEMHNPILYIPDNFNEDYMFSIFCLLNIFV